MRYIFIYWYLRQFSCNIHLPRFISDIPILVHICPLHITLNTHAYAITTTSNTIFESSAAHGSFLVSSLNTHAHLHCQTEINRERERDKGKPHPCAEVQVTSTKTKSEGWGARFGFPSPAFLSLGTLNQHVYINHKVLQEQSHTHNKPSFINYKRIEEYI